MIKKKNRHKIFVLGLIISMYLFSFSGCGGVKTENKNEPAVETGQNVQESPDNTQEETDAEEVESGTEETETPVETETITEINIYGLNEDSLESEPAKASITGDITAESIVQAVVDNYKKNSIEIGIYSVVEENNKVIVSFKEHMAPLENVGSGVEETILNCISDSLMDNLDTCQAVIFRGEDKPYESGHYAFDMDEVYASE